MTKYTWTDATRDNAFTDPANWSPGGGPPGANDVAVFSSLNSVISGNGAVGQIQVLAATSIEFTGQISALGLAGVTDGVQIGGNAQVSFAAGSSLTVATTLDVGLSGGRSSLEMQGAGLTTQYTTIGATAGSEGTVGLSSGYWQNSKYIVIAKAGSGDLSVGAGATLSVGSSANRGAGKIILGMQQGSTGVLSVSDGGYVVPTSDVWIGGMPNAARHGVGIVSIASGGDIYAGGTVAVAAGSTVNLADGYLTGFALSIAAGATLSGSGAAGSQEVFTNNGLITAYGVLDLSGSDIEGTGTIDIAAGADLLLLGPVLSQGAISFAGPGGTLNLDQYPVVQAPVSGFAPGDTIMAAYADSVSFNAATDILTLYSAGTSEGTITLSGNYVGATFHDAYQGSEGMITVTLGHSPSHPG